MLRHGARVFLAGAAVCVAAVFSGPASLAQQADPQVQLDSINAQKDLWQQRLDQAKGQISRSGQSLAAAKSRLDKTKSSLTLAKAQAAVLQANNPDQIDQLKQDLAGTQSELDSILKDSADRQNTLISDLGANQQLIDETNGQLEATAQQIEYTGRRLADLQAEIGRIRQDQADTQKQLDVFLRATYKEQQRSLLEFLLDSVSFGDFLTHVTNLQSVAQQQGKTYGTPAGSIMCTGAYKLKSFKPGTGVTAVANPQYWNSSVKPLVSQILVKGAPDISSFTSAMLTGAIQGSYSAGGIATLNQLEHSSSVKVYQGPGWSTDAFIVSSFSGALGDVRVRRALSLALNRKGIIDSVYKGAAVLPRWLSNPGTFGYGESVFNAAYARSPVLTQNIAAARKLVQAAGATGKTITIGTSSQLSDISADAGAYQAAAQAIGLKAALKSVSAQNYINFFIDPKARQGIDGFLTANYGDYADPAAMLATLDLPGGSQNYDNFNDPAIVSALEQARGTADPGKRAALVAQAEKLTAQQLPWIPDVQPNSLLMLSRKLSGAVVSFAYMFAPWANSLGGTG